MRVKMAQSKDKAGETPISVQEKRVKKKINRKGIKGFGEEYKPMRNKTNREGRV